MKSLTLMLILFTFSFSYSQTPVKNFEEMMTSLKQGKDLKAVINYGMCVLKTDSTEEKGPEAIGGMEIKTFEYFAPGAVYNPKGYLTCSETQLINHYKRGYVLNYVKLKIVEDNTVIITARYLNPSDNSVVMDESFNTIINNGNNDGGVYLYSK